jgi:hypothetical protein
MDLQKLKRLNLRQPKYIFPLVIFLPLLGLIYFGMETFKGNGKTAKNVVTDSINMSLPEARSEGMDDKMTAMNKRFAEGGAFTAVDGIGDEYEQKDTTGSGYNDKERQDIDAVNAERLRQMKAEQDLRERQQANMNRINGYGSSGYGGSGYGGSGYGNRSYGGGRTQQETSTTMPVNWSASRTAAWIANASTMPSRSSATRKRKPRKDGSNRR